jgi:hypothetical protein
MCLRMSARAEGEVVGEKDDRTSRSVHEQNRHAHLCRLLSVGAVDGHFSPRHFVAGILFSERLRESRLRRGLPTIMEQPKRRSVERLFRYNPNRWPAFRRSFGMAR